MDGAQPEPVPTARPAPDFRALFESAPGLYLVLTPDLTITAASDAYLRATMTARERIVGRSLFDVFPDNPADPTATGVRNLRASLDRVLRYRTTDVMVVQKYDIRRPEAAGGGFEERYWSPTNTPVLGPGGAVTSVIHQVEDVTELVRLRQQGTEQAARADELGARLEAENLLRAQELQEANRQLRVANEELNRLRADLERRVEERTAELTRKREKLRVTLESIGDAVITTDPAGRVTLLNHVAEALTGWPAAEAVGAPLTDVFRIINQQTRQSVENPVRRVIDEGVIVGLANHTVLISRDGTERPIDDSAAPIRDETGALLGVVLIFRDVSERYAAEEALRREREFVRAVLDTDPDLIFVKDAAGRFVLVNKALANLYGTTPEELIGRDPAADGRAPGEVPEYRRIEQEVLSTGRAVAADERNSRPDGRVYWFHTVKVPLRLPDGTTHVLGIATDITQRHVAEDALRASEERLRLLIDSVREYAIFTTDPDGRVLTWNSGAERAYGYPAAEAIGLHLSRFYTPDEIASGAADDRLTRAAEAGSHYAEAWRVRKDGTWFWAEVVTTALRDGNNGDGPSRGFVIVARDMTERRKLEDQFRQAQKLEAVGRLAGGVAHDFNNILTVINGYGDLLLVSTPATDSRREALVAIRDAGERAAGLTNQLLAFSRKAIVEPRVLDLNEVIDQLARLLRRMVGEDVLLATALAPGLHRVKADPTQVEQIILNLAVNARDAMPKGGRLTLETRNVRFREADVAAYPDLPPGHYVQLAVSDTGTGMTDEVKAKIFEPFFTTKELGKGTGLGLAMVYGAVKTHSGHISVYSELGVGSTFKILLPATFEMVAPRSGEIRPAPRGSETILIAEDDDTVRQFTRLALESQGYVVLDGGSGAESLRVAEDHRGLIHLLVTDVVMPVVGGRDLADALRARHPGLKVLYVSGYTDDAVVRHGIVEATDAFLQKPFTALALARKVRAVLDGTV